MAKVIIIIGENKWELTESQKWLLNEKLEDNKETIFVSGSDNLNRPKKGDYELIDLIMENIGLAITNPKYSEADEISDEDLEATAELFDKIVKEKPKRGLSSIIQESDFEGIMKVEIECDPSLEEKPENRRDREILLRECIDDKQSFKVFIGRVCRGDYDDEMKFYLEEYQDGYREYLGWDSENDTTDEEDLDYYNS